MAGEDQPEAAVHEASTDAPSAAVDEDRFWRLLDFTIGFRNNLILLALGLLVPIVVAQFVAPEIRVMEYLVFLFAVVFLAGLVFAAVPNHVLHRHVLTDPRFAGRFMRAYPGVKPDEFRAQLFAFIIASDEAPKHRELWVAMHRLERFSRWFWRTPWLWIIIVFDLLLVVLIAVLLAL